MDHTISEGEQKGKIGATRFSLFPLATFPAAGSGRRSATIKNSGIDAAI
jgi:hypothetical protein